MALRTRTAYAKKELLSRNDQGLLWRANPAHPITVQSNAVFNQPAHRAGIQHVLLDQYTRGQLVFVVIGQYRNDRLGDDRAVVELACHKMHRRAVHAHACGQRLGMGIQTRKRRQKRRMDVHQPALIPIDKTGRKDTHETREYHDIRSMGIDARSQRHVKLGALRISAVIDALGRNIVFAGESQTLGIGPVADDRNNPRGPSFQRTGIDDRLHIAAAAGNQDDDVFHAAKCITRILRAKAGPWRL